MPFILIGSGLVLILSGIKGDPAKLYDLVAADFTGKNNYLYWMLSILILGALGYVKELQPFSRAFIVLIVVVLFLHNKGFIDKFQQQVFGASTGGASNVAAKTSAANSAMQGVTPAQQAILDQVLLGGK